MKKRNNYILTLTVSAITLFVLIILSIIILLTRLGVSLPFTDDTFVLIPEFESVEFADDKVIWDMDTEVSIFKFNKVDEYGNILVESIDGNKVIAPGMSGDYRFEIKNYGNFAVDTTVLVNCALIVNGEVFENCPIEIRLSDYIGESINGGFNKVSEIDSYKNELTIAKEHYIYYTLDWRWNFEGDDELDTLIGDLSDSGDVEFKVSIIASATRCPDKNSDGGLEFNKDIPEVGQLDIRPFIAINVIAFLIIVILLAYANKERKKKAKLYRFVSKK